MEVRPGLLRATWSSQRDVELAQLDCDHKRGCMEERALPSPTKAAFASALAFSVGALLSLLAAGFIVGCRMRVAVVVSVATLAQWRWPCSGMLKPCWAGRSLPGPAQGCCRRARRHGRHFRPHAVLPCQRPGWTRLFFAAGSPARV